MQAVIDFFAQVFDNPYLSTFLISAVPVVELRGAIPFGMYHYGLPFYQALLLSVAGGAAVTLLLLLFLTPTFSALKRTRLFRRMVCFFEEKFAKKSDEIERKATESERSRFVKWISVFVLVAVPLPGTGVWTGSAVAAFLSMKKREAFFAVTLGNIVAGLLVSLISLLLAL
ncbi:MAG: small multi-drug export protein [Clostridia bacterium]|nr:small multi-drug export protein [Clostridia bacterium]